MTPAWQQLERVVRTAGVSWAGEPGDVPEPIARYFGAAMPDGRLLAPAAVLKMRGRIKIGRWLPFRARQLLAPRYGTVWEARVAGVIVGSDRYVAGVGGMTWKLLGVIPFVRAEGVEVSRSSAERAAGESIWVPSAVAPCTGTSWSVVAEDRIAADVDSDGHSVRVEHRIDADGRLRESSFLRWGDPDGSGVWSQHRFGMNVTSHERFGSLVIPAAGEAGWHHGTDRWTDGVFFRFRISEYRTFPRGDSCKPRRTEG